MFRKILSFSFFYLLLSWQVSLNLQEYFPQYPISEKSIGIFNKFLEVTRKIFMLDNKKTSKEHMRNIPSAHYITPVESQQAAEQMKLPQNTPLTSDKAAEEKTPETATDNQVNQGPTAIVPTEDATSDMEQGINTKDLNSIIEEPLTSVPLPVLQDQELGNNVPLQLPRQDDLSPEAL